MQRPFSAEKWSASATLNNSVTSDFVHRIQAAAPGAEFNETSQKFS